MEEIKQLTNRVRILEQQVRKLRSADSARASMPAWKRKLGLFSDDDAFARIVRLGAKLRRAGQAPPKRATKSNSRRSQTIA
jgi:hypothetical protein